VLTRHFVIVVIAIEHDTGTIANSFESIVRKRKEKSKKKKKILSLVHHSTTCFFQQDEERPYAFYVDDVPLDRSVRDVLASVDRTTEKVLEITYQPQALFRVRAVQRCTASLAGHTEAVLSVAFAPDGSTLCSGSGDHTVRVWDLNTQTPAHTLRGHRGWILCIAWCANGLKIASGSMDGEVRIWDPISGRQLGVPLTGHTKHVNAISWEPLHADPSGRRLVSASKDQSVRIWDTLVGRCLFALSGHALSVTCARWGGEGLIYTGGQDRLVKVWNPDTGVLVRELKGHAHWINTMALSTDYALRSGACDIDGRALAALRDRDMTAPSSASSTAATTKRRRLGGDDADAATNASDVVKLPEDAKMVARTRYDSLRGPGERMVTGSDDFTMLLWHPHTAKKAVARLIGHQQLVNDVRFTPDGTTIASASFDKSIRLWHGVTGKFIATLRGHVQSVFQLAWSPDGRMLVSASRDSTVKVWQLASRKLLADLPGHADEVYAVDWSALGDVASGAKDRLLKIWRN
jgi:ribosome assembly protein 4